MLEGLLRNLCFSIVNASWAFFLVVYLLTAYWFIFVANSRRQSVAVKKSHFFYGLEYVSLYGDERTFKIFGNLSRRAIGFF